MDDSLGIYLSIPFCKAKCSFCNFASGAFAADRMQAYVDRLCAELREARAAARSLSAALPVRVDSVYFGGGTPSLLEGSHLRQIVSTLRGEFEVDVDAEMTLESAPGQVAGATLEAALELGVNRVSFGVQSFVDEESAAVGRLHTGAECLAELARMRSAGVGRVSLDLIAGLPYQTTASWDDSLGQAVGSGVDHVSLYMLEVDEDSRLGREALAGGERYHAGALPSEDATADWYLAAGERLAKAGLGQYEISNFARTGFASRHNLKYWRRQPYLGVGLDAHSMLLCPGAGPHAAVRWANGDDMEGYLGDRASPLPVIGTTEARKVDRIDAESAFEESLFLGLRMNEGVDLERLGREFGLARLGEALCSLGEVETAGLVERSAAVLRLTPAGRLASNEVFSRLLAA